MTKDFPHKPFGQIVAKHTGNFSGTAGTMMTRAPWQSPVNKYYVIRKLVVSNMSNATSGGPNLGLAIWDQDLSNTSPTARGSAGGPLMVLPINGNFSGGTGQGGATLIPQDAMPPEYFQGGITMITYASGAVPVAISGIFVAAELEAI